MKHLKKSLKKALSRLLTLCMVVGMLSTNTFAASFDDLQAAISDTHGESESTDTTTGDSTGSKSDNTTGVTTDDSTESKPNDTSGASTGDSTESTTNNTAGSTTGDITVSKSDDTAVSTTDDIENSTTDDSTESKPDDTVGPTTDDTTVSTTDDTASSTADDTIESTTDDTTGSTTGDTADGTAGSTTDDSTGSTTDDTAEGTTDDTAGSTTNDNVVSTTDGATTGDATDTMTDDATSTTAGDTTSSTTDDTTGVITDDTTTGDTIDTTTDNTTDTTTDDTTRTTSSDTTSTTPATSTDTKSDATTGTRSSKSTDAALSDNTLGEAADTNSAAATGITSAVTSVTPPAASLNTSTNESSVKSMPDSPANGTEFDYTDADGKVSKRYGYGWNNALVNLANQIIKGWWGIEVWFEEGIRKVQLNEDVTYDSQDTAKSITIDGGKVDLDLGGHTIDGGFRAGKEVNGIPDKNPPKSVGSGTSVVRIVNGADVSISHGNITGGSNGSQGGQGSDHRCGGGILGVNSNLNLTNVNVYGYHATFGGGVFFQNDGGYSEKGNFTMEGGSIHHNMTGGYKSNGGGIYTKGYNGSRVTASMADVEIFNNNGGDYAGGIRTWGTDMILNNVNVTNNQGWYFAGGILVCGNSNVTMNGGYITGNHTHDMEDNGVGGGAGIFIDKGNNKAILNDVRVIGNTVYNGNGGGIFVSTPSNSNYQPTLILGENNKIYGNISPAGRSDIYADLGAAVINVRKAPLAPDNQMYDGWYTGNGNNDKYTGPETIEGAPVDLAGNVTYTVVHEYYTDGILDGSTQTSFKGIDAEGNGAGFVDADGIRKVSTYDGVSGYVYDASKSIAGNFSLTNATDDNVITLRYYRTTTPAPNPDPEPEPTPNPDPEPTPNPDPAPVIPESDVPLAGGSAGGGSRERSISAEVPAVEISEENVPLADMPAVEIPEEDVPLAGMPTVEIPEENVPLANMPKTGDNSNIWEILAAISGLGLVWFVLDKKRRGSAE